MTTELPSGGRIELDDGNDVSPTITSTVGLRLVHRRLTLSEATSLHLELKTTPNILGYTVRELLHFEEVIVAEAETKGDGSIRFAGACLSKDLLFNWTDIAVLYVLPSFRGMRASTTLFRAALHRAAERNRHIYTLSRNPQVIHLMEQEGMTVTRSVWKAPFAVHWDMQWHMMSLYRLQEAFRKAGMRQKDGYRFVAGMKYATK